MEGRWMLVTCSSSRTPPGQQCGGPQTAATHSSESQRIHKEGLVQLSVLVLLLLLLLSWFSHIQLFLTLWIVAHQAPLSMGLARQEYWNSCHALLQGIFSTQGLNLVFCIAGRFYNF